MKQFWNPFWGGGGGGWCAEKGEGKVPRKIA